MGVTLLESCMLDIRDSLLLKAEIQNFKEGSCIGDLGPNQEQVQIRTVETLLRQEKNLEKKLKSIEYLRLLHK